MQRKARPYTFTGTVREEPDPRRYAEAIRTWTSYVVRRLTEGQPTQKPGGE